MGGGSDRKLNISRFQISRGWHIISVNMTCGICQCMQIRPGVHFLAVSIQPAEICQFLSTGDSPYSTFLIGA